jgi:hypothetical protein
MQFATVDAELERLPFLNLLDQIARAKNVRPGHVNYMSKATICEVARRVVVENGWPDPCEDC